LSKVIYIQYHAKGDGYFPPQDMFPNFFTYSFAGFFGRQFKRFYPEWDVEVWRLDSTISEYREALIENVWFRLFPASGNGHIGLYSGAFTKRLRSLPPKTILNVQWIHHPLLYSVLLLAPKNLIVTAFHHGDWSPYFAFGYLKGFRRIKRLLYIAAEHLLINRARFFFLLDKRDIPWLRRTYRNLDGHYRIQPTGIDFSKYQGIPKDQARKELGLDPSKKYMFYLGQYYHYKEVDRLCEIYKRVREKDPNVRLMVAGGKPTDMYYRNIVDCGAIDFGRQPQTELYKFYSAADVYVMVAFRDDMFGGIGQAPLEALACGTPVVSNSIRNMPDEILGSVGKCPGNEEEMAEDILYVIRHKEEYADCASVARSVFDVSVLQKKMFEVYSQLLKEDA
jgi:glycosyltransferase involved in cell wall biosynthesis